MRSVKHQLIEGFDLHEENKVSAIFYLRIQVKVYTLTNKKWIWWTVSNV